MSLSPPQAVNQPSHSYANLPTELILEVFKYLSVPSLCICSQVCSSWRNCAEENTLWKRLYQKEAKKSLPLSSTLVDSVSKDLENPLYFPPPRSYLHYYHFQEQLIETTKGIYAREPDQRNWKSIYASKANWTSGKCSARTLQGHSNQVRCLQFDHSKIISGSLDQTIKIWNIHSGECVSTLKGHTRQVLCLQYDGEKIISGSGDSTIRVWDLETGKNIQTLRGHQDVVMCLQFDKSKIVSGGDDKALRMWDIRSGTVVHRIARAHSNLITCLQFDSTKLISGCWSGEVSVWDFREFRNGSSCVKLSGAGTDGVGMGNITCLQFDHEKLICGSTHHSSLQVWSTQTYKRLQGFNSFHHGIGVNCMQFDESKVVNVFRGKEMFVWDLASRRNRYILPGHSDSVLCLMFDESKIISGSKDKTIKIWDFASRSEVK